MTLHYGAKVDLKQCSVRMVSACHLCLWPSNQTSQTPYPAFGPNGEILHVYGDPGYSGELPHLQYPFKNANPMPEQHACNVEMSRHQICVEWGWGKAKTEFTALDWCKMQKIWLSPITMYFLCVLSAYKRAQLSVWE